MARYIRAITDLQLARADETPDRFYSMSAQIRSERNKYYDILEQTQKGSLDITEWLVWFLECMLNRLLDNFEGKLTSSKWAKMTKCSQDTAARDIQNLIERGILIREDVGGRSTSYKLGE